jgi:hypothetical protein
MRFTGDSLEMEAVTSGPELALVLESQTAPLLQRHIFDLTTKICLMLRVPD